MSKRQASDTQANYLPDEATILGQAEAILRKRLERLGSISNPEDASSFLQMRLGGLDHEEFHAVYLDTRHQIIAVEGLFRGTVDGAEVHPREVVRAAMRHNAAAVIFAHNHPSGNPEPSAADRAITARLKQALALVDVRVLDHIVVGERTVSLAARGWV
ncbi:MAG: DNA repair protein RadC [Xanthomonadaceae bacterium]|nr:DNA repair protein RadC [Xanthomonadaceae bacterium]